MNDLSKSLKILVDRYPGTMAELARQAQIDRSSLYKIMDGKRMPNRAQLQRLIHALGLNARQAEHLTTQYDELRSGAQAHRTDEALYELLQTAMRSRDNLMNDVLAPMPRSEADLEAAFTSRCYQGYQAVTQQLHLLLTRYNPGRVNKGDMLSMEDVLEILRINLVGVIPEDQSVLRASNQGEPVILDAASDAGKAYADTVERLLGEERPFRFIEEEKKGFLKRLFGG